MAKKKTQKTEKSKFQYSKELEGVLLVVLSMIGLGSYGIIGDIVKKIAVFLFGSWYLLLLGGSLIIGLYLLTMSGTLVFEKGEFLTLICAILFALQIIFTGKFSNQVNVFLLVLFQLITVSILALIFSLSLDSVTFNIPYNYAFFKAVIITAIFATVYAFLIQTYMQQFTTATKTAIIFTMEPVSAAIFAYFTANEVLTIVQFVGAVLIILATLIAELKFNKNPKHT